MNTQAPDQNEIFLIDGSGYIFRAYFALPQNLTNPEGVPVGAVLGFTNMMYKLLTDFHAGHIAVIFDAARKNFRYDIYDQYKANREAPPEDLIPQFALIKEATAAFGLPAIELEGFEADDLIATYARQAVEAGRKVTIVGSDKDLMQLVSDHVRLFDPMKNKYIGPDDVFEKFGVMPERVIDVQALAGDSVDNVPGVPGIGIKTAAQLITEFGDLENLLEKAETIKQPKRREALVNHANNARISKKLVTLDRYVDTPYKLDELKAHDPDTPQLATFLQAQGFRNLLARLGQKPNAAPTQTRSDEHINDAPAYPPAAQNEYTLINDMDVLRAWIARCFKIGQLAIDTETTSLSPVDAKLVGISIACEPGKAAYIPLGHVQERDLLGGGDADMMPQLATKDVIAALKPLLEDPAILKIGHNMKYDWQILAMQGVHITPIDDTMLLSYVLDGTNHGHGMDELAALFCNHQTRRFEDVAGKGKNQITFDRVAIKDALDYAAEDAEITLRLHHILKPRLVREQCAQIYEDVERPLVPVLAQMELTGVQVDPTVLQKMSHDFGMKLATLEKEIHEIAGHPFNLASPKQLGHVLFEEMGIKGGKKTKTGDWSTAAGILDELPEDEHPVIPKILEWRQLSKLKSTYTDALPQQISPATNRVHTSFQMTGTNTGRLSSTEPNLQNIPIRTEDGRRIRTAFVAQKGWKILSVDYSQVELRLIAALADVKALKQAFEDKVDIHALTASQVFGVKLAEVTPDLRRSAKAVNFGIIYGISGWGLAKQLGVSPVEAGDYIKRYLARFREISDYMEAKKAEARDHGYITTFYGRKVFINNIDAKIQGLRAGAERQAINAPLQGTAADIMKMAMARLPHALAEQNLRARMMIQVHDELVFEVPEEEAEKTATLVCAVMENVADVGVRLEAEAGFADSWADAH